MEENCRCIYLPVHFAALLSQYSEQILCRNVWPNTICMANVRFIEQQSTNDLVCLFENDWFLGDSSGSHSNDHED